METVEQVQAFWDNIGPLLKDAGQNCTNRSKVNALTQKVLNTVGTEYFYCEIVTALGMALMAVFADMAKIPAHGEWD